MLRESDHSMSLMEESEDGTNSLLTYCPIESEGKKGAIELSSQLTGFEQSRSIWLFGLLTICASALLGIAAVMTARPPIQPATSRPQPTPPQIQ